MARGRFHVRDILLWLVFFWITLTFGSFRTRDVESLMGSGGIDSQVVFQILSWLVFGGLAMLLILRKRVEWPVFLGGPMLWYCGFLLAGALSVLYSISPLFSLFFVFQIVVFSVLVASVQVTTRMMIGWIGIYALLNWILALLGEAGLTFGFDWIVGAEEMYLRYGGSPGEGWRLSTAIGHPSQVSVVAAMAAIALFALPQQSAPKFRWLIFIFLAVTVLATVSRTAIAGMFVGLALVMIMRRQTYLLITTASVGILATLIYPGFLEQLTGYLARGQSSDALSSLTGRSPIYDVAMDRAMATWWGEGFRSLRAEPLMDRYWGGGGVVHAHNLLLQATIETGIQGALMAVACLISLVRWSFWLAKRPVPDVDFARLVPIGVCGPILTFSILDSGFVVNLGPFVAAFIINMIVMRRQIRAVANLSRPDLQETVYGKNYRIVPGLQRPPLS